MWFAVNLVVFIAIQMLKFFKYRNYECPDFDAWYDDFDNYRKNYEGYSVINFCLIALTYFSYFWNFVQFISILVLSAVYRIKKTNLAEDRSDSPRSYRR